MSNRIEIPEGEISFTFSRSSGSGGQNVNKVSSKATLHWDFRNSAALSLTQAARFAEHFARFINSAEQVNVSCDSHRDQVRNRAECIARLTKMIQSIARAPRKRIATKPSRAARIKRVESKQHRASAKRSRKRWSEE